MKNIINPFELFSYLGPAYFCDRKSEIDQLNEAFINRRNTVVFSIRRLGKTSLVQHWHHLLEKNKENICIYIDVLDTESDEAFINRFISAVLNKLNAKENLINTFLDSFKNARPQIGVDPATGLPTMTVQIQREEEAKQSIGKIIDILTQRKEKIQLAFDEFQQIGNYDSTSIDATIRSFYPVAHNLHFLFLGSEQHLLQHLFTSPKKPMYSSAQMMKLDYIGYAPYFEFIKEKFVKNNKEIGDQHIHEILVWTRRHTFYTHFLCNQIFGRTNKQVDNNIITISKKACLKQFETNYYYYQKILSGNQWKLLKSIAKEKEVKNIYAKDFLIKYKFSASSLRQSLDSLIQNQLVSEKNYKDGNSYMVNDVFLSRWLEIAA